MSTQQWDDARLDRLANSIESLTNRVDSIAIATENNNRLIESNARAIQALGNRVDSIAIARVDSIAIATENNNRLIESNARVIQSLANVAAEAREERQQHLSHLLVSFQSCLSGNCLSYLQGDQDPDIQDFTQDLGKYQYLSSLER